MVKQEKFHREICQELGNHLKNVATTEIMPAMATWLAKYEPKTAPKKPTLVFTTSFGLEDQVLTDMIVKQPGLAVQFVTLDTGRLFPETYELWQRTTSRYGITITSHHPNADALGDYVRRRGINGFYEDVAARHECCAIRKTVPLTAALAGADIWLTGIRRDQSTARQEIPLVSHDPTHNVVKLNPILGWTRAQAVAYAEQHKVPLNPLHLAGYLSIGCAPCTRAVQPGESERDGRWWWENEAAKECGLHVMPDGRRVRRKDLQATPGGNP
ncbi:MAG: phosphoadenylyl-sulfate reductase [Candidatus Symbiobacter sp.]|nr:phosphoadenylyl-sulfate reductase [Candidatus Symbiobacter sp.]